MNLYSWTDIPLKAGWTSGGQEDAHALYLYLIGTLKAELPRLVELLA